MTTRARILLSILLYVQTFAVCLTLCWAFGVPFAPGVSFGGWLLLAFTCSPIFAALPWVDRIDP